MGSLTKIRDDCVPTLESALSLLESPDIGHEVQGMEHQRAMKHITAISNINRVIGYLNGAAESEEIAKEQR